MHLSKELTPIGTSVRQMQARAHPKVVVATLAAKLAGIAWAVLGQGRADQPQASMA